MDPLALLPDDAPRYARLRQEMLVDSPWSFFGAPGDDPASDVAVMRSHLADPANAVYALEDPADRTLLVAVAGVQRSRRVRHAHRAEIWGVYVTPRARRQGAARALLRACVAHARRWSGVRHIALSVSERSPGAEALYASLGFVRWGVEPDFMRIGDESANEHHMHLSLVDLRDGPSVP